MDLCGAGEEEKNFVVLEKKRRMGTSGGGTMVDRWLWSALQDMKENNRTEVLCPCRKCK